MKPHNNVISDTHLVFGAGLIGGYLAGGLLAAGFKTDVLARDAVKEKMSDGLTLSSLDGHNTQIPCPNFVDQKSPSNRNDGTYNYIWLTVKCTSVVSACEQLSQFINTNTVIISCQNGFGSDQEISKVFAENIMLRAIIGFNVAEVKPGHLHRATDGSLVIEQHSLVDDIIEPLNTPILPTNLSNDIVADQWAKLQLNLANSINALANIPVKQMIENAQYRKIIAGMMTELLNVTDAMQLNLPKLTSVPAHWIPRVLRLPNLLFNLVAQKMLAVDPSARTSMYWDLFQDRKTEIDFINGAIVEQARQLGIDSPLNQKIIKLIHQVEDGQESIGFSPGALMNKLN